MRFKSPSLLLLGMLALVGCSNLTQTPTSTTNVSLASTVSGNSSLLLVNGQPLDVSSASVTVDDETTGSAKDIKPGMEISGEGSTDDKGKLKMRHVEVRWRMKGIIDAVDSTNSTIDVVGLRAKVDSSTLIFKEDGTTETAISFADLKQGDYVKLAGLPQADDSLLATRIEVTPESDTTKTDFRVLARNLQSSAKTFTYGLKTLTVDYNSANVSGTPTEGALVRVKGTRSGNTVTASVVKGTEPGIPGVGNHDQHLELRGLVSDLKTDAKTFVVRGFTINYANATVEGTLADNKVVEIHGKVTGDKTADASRVEVEGDQEHSKPDDHSGTPGLMAKIDGTVTGFDGTNHSLKIHEVPISVSSTTKYEILSTEVTADVFWGTNRDGARAEAEGSVSSSGMAATKLEIK